MPRILLFTLLGLAAASAHDTWIQLNVAHAEARQPVYADLMLGNHGNNHRDFQLASKIPLTGSTLTLISPGGTITDLKPGLVDTSAEEKEGYWSARILPVTSGLHIVAHTYDAIVTYAPKRSIKGAKAFFLSGTRDGNETGSKFTTPIGHALEIIPLEDPTVLHSGDKLGARVLFKGQPLKDTVISCIPRGKELAGEFDGDHETKTNDKGEAILPLPEANIYLIVTHLKAPAETGESYSAGTEYSAALTVWVGVK